MEGIVPLVSHDFIFSIQEQEIFPFVIQVKEWIEKKIPLEKSCDLFFFKSKLIITELVTNGIKHANTNTFKLTIVIDKQFVRFQRIDSGKPFGLISEGQELAWPLPIDFFGKPLMILKDKMSNMFAVIKNHYSIEFKLEEYIKKDEEVINTLIEHYGLIIITKLSDEFIYRYDPDHQLNIFASTIKI